MWTLGGVLLQQAKLVDEFDAAQPNRKQATLNVRAPGLAEPMTAHPDRLRTPTWA
jgi:hypothetical protein